MRFVPSGIPRPEYAETGYPTQEIKAKQTKMIEVKTPQEIENLREACLIGTTIEFSMLIM